MSPQRWAPAPSAFGAAVTTPAAVPTGLPPIDSPAAWELFVTAWEEDHVEQLARGFDSPVPQSTPARRLLAAYTGLPVSTRDFSAVLGADDLAIRLSRHAWQRVTRERIGGGATPARPRRLGTR